MEAKEVLMLSIDAGEIMLSNGAETYRVEDTMHRILSLYGCNNPEAFVTATGIIASLVDDEFGPVSMVRRVTVGSYHIDKLCRVNELSRNLSEGKVSFEQAREILSDIRNRPPYPLTLRMLCSGISCFSFCYMFGGHMLDCVCAFIIGFLVYTLLNFFKQRSKSNFLLNIIGGAFISLCTIFLTEIGPGCHLDKIIVGSIMPLVPGLAFTNSIRDFLSGDYLSGTGRMVDAIMVAVGIATGVGTILRLWMYFS